MTNGQETTASTAAEILAEASRIRQVQHIEQLEAELSEERERLARIERREEAQTAILDDRAIEYGRAVMVKRWQLLAGLQNTAVEFARAHKAAEAQRSKVDLLERSIRSMRERLEASDG